MTYHLRRNDRAIARGHRCDSRLGFTHQLRASGAGEASRRRVISGRRAFIPASEDRHVMHLVSLAVSYLTVLKPGRPALMNEVTLRNADAYIRALATFHAERAFNADLRSGRAAFARMPSVQIDRERGRGGERDFLSNHK